MYVKNSSIESSQCIKLLDIKNDNKLNFNNHIDGICKKSRAEVKGTIKGYPLHGFTEVANAFFLSQFNYCLSDLIGSRDIKIPTISRDLFFRRDL